MSDGAIYSVTSSSYSYCYCYVLRFESLHLCCASYVWWHVFANSCDGHERRICGYVTKLLLNKTALNTPSLCTSLLSSNATIKEQKRVFAVSTLRKRACTHRLFAAVGYGSGRGVLHTYRYYRCRWSVWFWTLHKKDVLLYTEIGSATCLFSYILGENTKTRKTLLDTSNFSLKIFGRKLWQAVWKTENSWF
jgi:hypothetical protein